MTVWHHTTDRQYSHANLRPDVVPVGHDVDTVYSRTEGATWAFVLFGVSATEPKWLDHLASAPGHLEAAMVAGVVRWSTDYAFSDWVAYP